MQQPNNFILHAKAIYYIREILYMSFARIMVPAAPVRKKPKHQAEMTNQLVFGEAVFIIKQKNTLWVKIRSLHDQYEGWMTKNLLIETDEEDVSSPITHIASDNINKIILDGHAMYIPRGSQLMELKEGFGKLADKKFEYHGNFIERPGRDISGSSLEQLANGWLNAPYCWGGRTIFGVDCSGFVQVNFKMLGIDLPRDAWQQAQEGHPVKKLKDAQKGDLAFF